jgi:DNA-binding response OmpR family regulator
MTAASVILLLTSDATLKAIASNGIEMAGYTVTTGENPGDAARLLGRFLPQIAAVIVDLDSCVHGSVWLDALQSLAARVPAIAVSRLDPQFLGSVARRHGVSWWLSKPVSAEEIAGTVTTAVGASGDLPNRVMSRLIGKTEAGTASQTTKIN